jgi:hypothetical protein
MQYGSHRIAFDPQAKEPAKGKPDPINHPCGWKDCIHNAKGRPINGRP